MKKYRVQFKNKGEYSAVFECRDESIYNTAQQFIVEFREYMTGFESVTDIKHIDVGEVMTNFLDYLTNGEVKVFHGGIGYKSAGCDKKAKVIEC